MKSILAERTDMNWLFVILIAVVTLVATCGEPTIADEGSAPSWGIFAQVKVPVPRSGGLSQGTIDRTMIYKVSGVVTGALVVFFLSWFALYPTWLRRGKSYPVTLYGRFTGLAWTTSWLMALYVFWNDLVVGTSGTFWNVYGLRLLFGSIAVLLGLACLVIWRSEGQTSVK